MKLNIFIDVSIQPERFNILLEISNKYNLLDKHNIKIVETINECDVILFLVNSRTSLINLDDHYLFQTNTEPACIAKIEIETDAAGLLLLLFRFIGARRDERNQLSHLSNHKTLCEE